MYIIYCVYNEIILLGFLYLWEFLWPWKLISSEYWMNFFSGFVFLMIYLGYICFNSRLYFYHSWWWEREKNQFFMYFWRILLNVEEKDLEINKHCWLSIQVMLKKSNPYNLWRHFRNQTTLTAPFYVKFTFDNSNSPCLGHFSFCPDNCVVRLQILSYQELNLLALSSSLVIHEILFSFSRLAILILILKSTPSQKISGIFVQSSQKPPYFCHFELTLK